MITVQRASLSACHASLLRSLQHQLDGAVETSKESGEIPRAHYTSSEHLQGELDSVFRRLPQVVAMAQELDAPGAQVAVEVAGIALLLVRGEDGTIRGFRNVCRHRSTQLVQTGPPCVHKAIVCPYHGWTYDLSGRLLFARHAESFCGRDAERSNLVEVPTTTAHGFVFAALEPIDPAFLAPIERDLEAIDADHLHPYRRVERVVAGNWKLIIEAFLDGYHVRHLHRRSVYEFFLDACLDSEPAGQHIRSLVARRAIVAARERSEAIEDLRSVATPSYLFFPNTILILHPDYLSVAVSHPLGVDRTRFVHTMLIPEAPQTEKARAHWDKSFELIDGGVFAREDLFVVEAMQRGLESRANASQLFGDLERSALWFHRSLERLRGG